MIKVCNANTGEIRVKPNTYLDFYQKDMDDTCPIIAAFYNDKKRKKLIWRGLVLDMRITTRGRARFDIFISIKPED